MLMATEGPPGGPDKAGAGAGVGVVEADLPTTSDDFSRRLKESEARTPSHLKRGDYENHYRKQKRVVDFNLERIKQQDKVASMTFDQKENKKKQFLLEAQIAILEIEHDPAVNGEQNRRQLAELKRQLEGLKQEFQKLPPPSTPPGGAPLV